MKRHQTFWWYYKFHLEQNNFLLVYSLTAGHCPLTVEKAIPVLLFLFLSFLLLLLPCEFAEQQFEKKKCLKFLNDCLSIVSSSVLHFVFCFLLFFVFNFCFSVVLKKKMSIYLCLFQRGSDSLSFFFTIFSVLQGKTNEIYWFSWIRVIFPRIYTEAWVLKKTDLCYHFY